MTEKKVSSEKLREKVERMPIIETKVRTSKDGHWIITETIIRDIKPATFWEKVLKNKGQENSNKDQEELF